MGTEFTSQKLIQLSLFHTDTQLYQFDGIAYESVVVGLFSIITGKRCKPPRPFKRGGEQDAVYVGFSRDGFNFQRSPVRTTAFLPMSTKLHTWNFREPLPPAILPACLIACVRLCLPQRMFAPWQVAS